MLYNDLKRVYSENFSLGYLNTDIKNKFALISLICEVTRMAKSKKPDITHYQIVYKMCEEFGLPDDFIKGLAVVCEDFAYGCTEFITFGLKPKEYVKTIKDILRTYMPF